MGRTTGRTNERRPVRAMVADMVALLR
jgi:hypothetical protein